MASKQLAEISESADASELLEVPYFFFTKSIFSARCINHRTDQCNTQSSNNDKNDDHDDAMFCTLFSSTETIWLSFQIFGRKPQSLRVRMYKR